MTKSRIDAQGAAFLILVSFLLGANQVVMKLTSEGLSPVFQSGLRSGLAGVCIAGWMMMRGIRFPVDRASVGYGLMLGGFFAYEFLCLYIAVDRTSVSHVSIMFYTMPVHLSVMAHFLIPGERLTTSRIVGLGLCVIAVALVMSDRGGQHSDLTGDLIALAGSFGWAALGILMRAPVVVRMPGEGALMWQLGVSAPVLLLAAPFFGPLVRDLQPAHVWLMGYQIFAVGIFCFMAWIVLIRIYPAPVVASYSFLSPVFSVFCAWAILGEALRPSVLLGLALVSAGIYLINRRARHVPQKVA